ncbi:MAG: lactonase family protein [Erysipelotrichaceae bacterium]|nr:lactonase family protein [Erysipelotrichaceae bacterium]
MKRTIYAGTYTGKGSEGIYRFSCEDGKLCGVSLFAGIDNPKYLCGFQDGIAALCDFKEGSGISLIGADGRTLDDLRFEDVTSCYITEHEGRLYTANYHAGTFSVLRIDQGRLALEKTILIKEKAGCHQVLFWNDLLLVPCLFLDKVMIYDKDLNDQSEIVFPAGSGPRHGVFSKDGKYLYLVSELSNELFVIRTGSFEIIACLPLLENGERNTKGTAAIRMSIDGKYLYVSTRGKDVISVLSVDKNKVDLIQNASCDGSHPRDFILLDDVLLCANRFSNEVVSFRIGKDGKVEEEIDRIGIPDAVCLMEE